MPFARCAAGHRDNGRGGNEDAREECHRCPAFLAKCQQPARQAPGSRDACSTRKLGAEEFEKRAALARKSGVHPR